MSNYLPFAGYWFYGAASATQRAAFMCSWGLLSAAPITGLVMAARMAYYRFRRL